MANRSRHQVQLAQRRQKVAQLYLQNWPQASIAEHLAVAQSTVSSDLKRIQSQWRESAVRDFDAQVALELAKIDCLEREAWAAWERSQKPLQQARLKGAQSEQAAERTIKNQVGDPRFLEQVQKCITARRAILGLDAPARVEPAPAPLAPLNEEQRRQHVEAIIRALKSSALINQDEAHGLRRLESPPVEAERSGTAGTESLGNAGRP